MKYYKLSPDTKQQEELMFFVTLLFALLSIVPKKAATDPSSLKSHSAKQGAEQFSYILDMYYVDCRDFPERLQFLVEKPNNCKNWGPHPCLAKITLDPWDQLWIYQRVDTKNWKLISYGADRKEGGTAGDADIILQGTAPKFWVK